jgi:phospholipid-binding lipoprotein MlaA
LARWLIVAALGIGLTGCGTLSGALRADSAPAAPSVVEIVAASEPTPAAETAVALAPAPVETGAAPEAGLADGGACELGRAESGESTVTAAPEGTDATAVAEALQYAWMAQARDTEIGDDTSDQAEQYDPWEPFNERMLEFNRRLDRWLLKPVAQAYNFITPDQLQIMISNGFDNISFPPRFVNSLLQGKFGGATREIGRFLINSTIGVGGLFDPAKDVFGIVKSREDFGQTLGFYGVGPGPFLIVPFMEPMTVRDGIGKFVDGAMDPLAYYLPLFWDRLGMKVGDILNERSLNLDLFQGFEESVIDLYSAVRHGYLQRRQKLIRE